MDKDEALIHKFFVALSDCNANLLCSCYHPDVEFSDPVFGTIKGTDVRKMWFMLLKKSKGNLEISFSISEASQYVGTAHWVAKYNFTKTNRRVENKVITHFKVHRGFIVKQTDTFDIWEWSKQALGWKGYLLGWTGYFQKEIQKNALESLKSYSLT